MATRRIATAAQESVSSRSIYVRVKPMPVGLSERRSLLRALQEYGEIEVFKKQQDDSSFISVASKYATAAKLVANSPLQCEFTPRHGLPTPARPPTPPSAGARRKVFQLEIFPAPDYKHLTRIALSPLYGPWPEGVNKFNETRSLPSFALRRRLRGHPAGKGLADWETGGQTDADEETRTDRLFQIQDRQRRNDRDKLAREMPLADAPGSPQVPDESTADDDWDLDAENDVRESELELNEHGSPNLPR